MGEKIRQEDAAPDQELQKPLAVSKTEGHKLAANADAHGDWEIEAAKSGRALLAPMPVSASALGQVRGLAAFKTAYETYKLPLHDSSMAISRVQDLMDGGAPRTPAEVSPALMRKFKKVDNVSRSTDEKFKATDANAFIAEQGDLKSSYASFMAARTQITGVLDRVYAAQEKTRQRKIGKEIAKDQTEVHEIDERAETLAKIGEVTQETLTFMSGFDADFLGAEETYTPTAEMEDGEAIQTAEVERKGKFEKLKEAASKAGGAIDLKTIFIELMGDEKKYNDLKSHITSLKNTAADSKTAEEDDEINAAWKDLNSVKIQISVGRSTATRKRFDARNASQAFGQAMNGQDSTILVSMMAEAYQELDLYGGYALTTGADADRKARPVMAWLNDSAGKFSVERRDIGFAADYDFVQDFEIVGAALKDLRGSYTWVRTEAPKWQEAATAWKRFLTDVMGKSFDGEEEQDEASADRERS